MFIGMYTRHENRSVQNLMDVGTARLLVSQGQTEWRPFHGNYFGTPEGLALALMSDTDPLSLRAEDDGENAWFLKQALDNYGKSRDVGWIPVLEQLVRIRSPHGCWNSGESALIHLLVWSNDPDDSEALAASWLDVLARAGLDVDSYL